jgi:hypothetical protein
MPVDFTLVKISELPVAGGVADGDELVINQSGTTARIRKDDLAGSFGVTSSGVIISTIEVIVSEEITVPAGRLLWAVVVLGAPGDVKVGTTVGGDEILADEITGTQIVYSTLQYFETSTIVWLTGTGTFKLYFAA